MSRVALGIASMLVAVAVGSAAPPDPKDHRLSIVGELADLLAESTATNGPKGDDLDPDTEAATAVPDAKSVTTLVRDSAPPEASTHDQPDGAMLAS